LGKGERLYEGNICENKELLTGGRGGYCDRTKRPIEGSVSEKRTRIREGGGGVNKEKVIKQQLLTKTLVPRESIYATCKRKKSSTVRSVIKD